MDWILIYDDNKIVNAGDYEFVKKKLTDLILSIDKAHIEFLHSQHYLIEDMIYEGLNVEINDIVYSIQPFDIGSQITWMVK